MMKLFRKAYFILPVVLLLLCLITYLINSHQIDTQGKVCREFSIDRRVIQKKYIFIEEGALNSDKENNLKRESFREVYQLRQGEEELFIDIDFLDRIVDAQDYYIQIKNKYLSNGIEVGIGDQSCLGQGGIIYIRNNIFVMIRNDEDDVTYLLEIAKDIDKQIIKTLEPE